MLLRACFVAVLAFPAWAQDTPPVAPPQEEIAPLIVAGNARYLKGEYADARDSYEKAWDLAKLGKNEDPARYEILKRLATTYAALGDYQSANDRLSSAISWREQTNGLADPKIADDLLQSV